MTFAEYISVLFYYVQLITAPAMLVVFTLVTAYVFRFNVPKSGLSFDYFLFTLLLVITMYIGGAI